MQAAIYARKSTDQHVADEAKSVRRQIDHAREFATRKGWTVAEAHVFVDDGVSGAEFANRPGFVRLMNALKPSPPFQVLVISEELRLGREAIETGYALKQIIGAGVRVFYYLTDSERTLDSPTDKILMALTGYAAEMERDQARARMQDTMQRKARAGHVCGGSCFGYDNHVVLVNGQRSHVEQRINDAEANVIRRIFELAAAGVSQVGIAKRLNAEGHPAPRSQQGRPRAWVSSSVHEALYRPRYRGELVWGQTRKRDRWGQRKLSRRPDADRIVVAAPHLQIVSDGLWQAAHARIVAARKHTNIWRGARSIYLLPGHARCGWCGGGVHIRSQERAGGRRRAYGCTSHFNRGDSVCRNALLMPMETLDAAVLAKLADIVTPAMVEEVVAGVREAMAPERSPRARLEAEIAALDRQVANLADAIAVGGNLSALVAKLTAVERDRQDAAAKLDALADAQVPRIDWRRLERQTRRFLADWRTLLHRNTVEARQVLAALLVEPIRLTPVEEPRGVRFDGRAEIGGILAGTVQVIRLVSPDTFGSLFAGVSFGGEVLIDLPRSA